MQLSTKAIQSPALPLQCVDYIHGSHSLPLGMLSVGDSIADNILQEDLKCRQVVIAWLTYNITLSTPLVSS